MIKNVIFCYFFFSIMQILNAVDREVNKEIGHQKISISHTFTNETGTYDVKALMQWVSSQSVENIFEVPSSKLANFLILDTWSEPGEPTRSNLKQFVENESHRQRILSADLSYPIVLTNDNVVIDGVHRLAKAMYEGLETVKCVFIDRSKLIEFRITELGAEKGLKVVSEEVESLIHGLPINDRLLKIAKGLLAEDDKERRSFLEDYFPEQLPTATDKGDHWEVRLERPSTPYGCYMLDPEIRAGLEWWKLGTRIRDIPIEKRILKDGVFALEDQWSPLSWSLYFEKNGSIPKELILLHIDDHQDMMSPRIGPRLDGQYVDFIAGDRFSLLKPETVESAILSGALGKGSILTPLIWQVDKIHVRHLTLRPTPHLYALKKALQQDPVLGNPLQRISVQCEKVEKELLLSSSNYVPASNVDTWLSYLPDNLPILLHIDMDFFNNRFDGSSSWEDADRCHDINLQSQQSLVMEIFNGLEKRGLEKRIVDFSLCISPSFFPAEFWQPISDLILEESKKLGII